MNRIKQMRTEREWRILGTALLVPLLELIFLLTEHGRGALRSELAESFSGIGATVLMLLA